MLDFFNANPSTDLRPARALLTPTWIIALVLLVANDHWFKGSGLLPDLLTGKLSDLAGMLVAPVLLATLLRVRTRRALLACHVAVASVFAGIQLAPGFAAQWSALMGLFGHPWTITCDPTDLVALPLLLLSWALLVPEMDASKPALLPLQRTAIAGLSVFGLWSTVATTDGRGPDDNDEWYNDVEGNVYINNANDFSISLYIRPLRDDLQINCGEIALDPGRLLTDDAFGEAEHWDLPAWTTVGVDFSAEYVCGAALIAGEGIPPIIVFGNRFEYQTQRFPGQVFDRDDLGVAGLGVEFGGEGGTTWTGNDALRFTPSTDAPELPAACEAPSGESRLDWSTEIPTRPVELLSITAGVDGCHELELLELRLVGGVVEPFDLPYNFYLCAPDSAAPYVAGERLEFDSSVGAETGQRELSVSLLDNETLELATDPSGAPIRRIHYLRGGNNPTVIAKALDRALIPVAGVSCPWQVETGCATVERPVEFAFGDEGNLLEPGVPVSVDDPAATTRLSAILSFARQRALVDERCSDGAHRLHYDIDFIAIEEPLL